VRAIVALWIVVVSIACTGAAWWRDSPLLGADEAASAAVDALLDAGLEAELVGLPRAITHLPQDGSGELAVWEVQAAVETAVGASHIDLRVAREDGAIVLLDDRAPDGSPLLTDAQVQTVSRFRADPAVEQAGRNLLATLAALLAAGTALAAASIPLRRTA